MCYAPRYPEVFLQGRLENKTLDICFSSVKKKSNSENKISKGNKEQQKVFQVFFKSKKQNKDNNNNGRNPSLK